MEKTIIVGKECIISQKDIAPCRDRDTAVCITQKVQDEKGFINFMLAIDNTPQCCESWDADLIDVAEYDKNSVYIEKIVMHEDTSLLKHLEWVDIATVAEIHGKEGMIAYAYVSNWHNGYYSHEVYCDVNGKTEVEYI